MKLTKKDFIDILPIIIAVGFCIYWIATGDKVHNDPYLLGLFRGVIYPSMIYSIVRSWLYTYLSFKESRRN